MPEVLGSPPSPRTALFWNGTAWQWALVDAAGHLQLDVLSTAMNPLAATAANQALINANLVLITELRGALQTVATNRLITRGEDQLFSFRGVLASTRTAVISGAGGWVDSAAVPAGEIWHVTHIVTYDATSPTTGHNYHLRHDGVDYIFHSELAALGGGTITEYKCEVWLDPGDTIRLTYPGALAGDSCTILLVGKDMTLET